MVTLAKVESLHAEEMIAIRFTEHLMTECHNLEILKKIAAFTRVDNWVKNLVHGKRDG